MKDQCINEGIKEDIVQLVMDDGDMRGQVPKYLAMNIAIEKGLDLVQVSASKDGKPPICKLMDYGREKYKEAKSKKRQQKQVTKEIKFSFNISDHDMQTKINKIAKFMSKKYHVKFTLELRGRYRYMKDMSRGKMSSHLDSLKEIAQWDKVSENNNNFFVILKPIGK